MNSEEFPKLDDLTTDVITDPSPDAVETPEETINDSGVVSQTQPVITPELENLNILQTQKQKLEAEIRLLQDQKTKIQNNLGRLVEEQGYFILKRSKMCLRP